MKTIEGSLNAAGKKFVIVAARWNAIFTDRLVEGAIDALRRHGSQEANITVVRVPGSFEIPVVVRKLADTKQYHAIIALGTLIRGETDHYDLIARQATSGLGAVMMETGVPVAHGILVADTMEQAMARAGSKAGNKGYEAAIAAIETANVIEHIAGIEKNDR